MPSAEKRKQGVVADTNILISALHFGGEAETFLAMASSRLFHLVISKYILWETKTVLKKKFGWSMDMIKEAEAALTEIAEVNNPRRTLAVIVRDEADNRILECAVAAEADFLVTNDKRHLLPLRSFRGIKIMSLKEFLATFIPIII